MGTGLVPIHLLAIIVQSNVVLKVVFEAIAAPPASDLFSEGVDPDRRAASCYQDLRAHVTFPVHVIVCRSTLHPVAELCHHLPCVISMLSAMFLDILRSCSSQVSCSSSTHVIFSFLLVTTYHLIVASLWLDACGLLLGSHRKISGSFPDSPWAMCHGPDEPWQQSL